MSTKLNDIITLDKKKYVVASMAKLKKEQYLLDIILTTFLIININCF